MSIPFFRFLFFPCKIDSIPRIASFISDELPVFIAQLPNHLERSFNKSPRHSGSHAGHSSNKIQVPVKPTTAEQASYINAHIRKNGHPIFEKRISLPGQIAEYPVVTGLGKNAIGIAWGQRIDEENFGIFYRKMGI